MLLQLGCKPWFKAFFFFLLHACISGLPEGANLYRPSYTLWVFYPQPTLQKPDRLQVEAFTASGPGLAWSARPTRHQP